MRWAHESMKQMYRGWRRRIRYAGGAVRGARRRRVTLLERNEKLGKKLYITGKGRCNVTNASDMEQYQRNIFRIPGSCTPPSRSWTTQD